MPQLSRRQFVRTVAAAGTVAASTGLRIKSARAEVEPSDRIRLGVIGYGSRGRGNLAEFLRNPEVECAAVCDVVTEHRENAVAHVEAQRGNRPDAYTDFRRIIERDDIDALLVSTPDHWHALPTVLGCETGKDTFLEKPFARTIDEGRAILEAAAVHGRIVQMGTQWRSAPHYNEAKAFFDSGALGALRAVRAWSYKTWDGIAAQPDGPVPEGVDYDLWLGPAPARPFNPNRFNRHFRWYWDYAGGLMTDLGVHLLNICQWFTGLESPTRISSMGGLPLYDGVIETPDTQVASYRFQDYTLLWEHQLQSRLGPNMHSPLSGDNGVCFSGSNASLIVTPGGWEVVSDPGGDGTVESQRHEQKGDGRPAHVRNFLDCIVSREQPVSHAAVGHHVTALAHLGNLAYRAGSDLLWDGDAEQITNSAEADALVGEPYRAPWTLPHARRT